MGVRIETADLGLAAIDALDTEALALFVGPERPLQGLAGFADWRLCGLISRTIRDGRFEPDTGEALLLPSGGRIAVPRIFCFGLPRPLGEPAEFMKQATHLTVAMRKAGSASWAGALPATVPGALIPTIRLFLEALLPVAPQKLVLLGEARPMYKDLLLAREALQAGEVEIVAPISRVEMPPRGPGLSHPGAVVR
ncbi:MAG TPA: peptidase M17 [Anaeromyxobacteraceae bacterium]|nr:peptidase M17 [Anaeromyxobacteraceae bacterium]